MSWMPALTVDDITGSRGMRDQRPHMARREPGFSRQESAARRLDVQTYRCDELMTTWDPHNDTVVKYEPSMPKRVSSQRHITRGYDIVRELSSHS